jgi:hypothetical protein
MRHRFSDDKNIGGGGTGSSMMGAASIMEVIVTPEELQGMLRVTADQGAVFDGRCVVLSASKSAYSLGLRAKLLSLPAECLNAPWRLFLIFLRPRLPNHALSPELAPACYCV